MPDSFDLNEHRLNYMSTMASSAHTYGSLLASVQKWFLKMYPSDLFKTIHVSSRMAHTQILSTPTQFLKKTKPMIKVPNAHTDVYSIACGLMEYPRKAPRHMLITWYSGL